MRPLTLGVAAVVLLALVGLAALGLADTGSTLEERWVSDTPRDNRANHHAVGAENGTVVAPVAAVTGTVEMTPTSCALVRLDPATGAVEWRAGVRPANCTTHALTEPAIADVDGDGHLEVAASSTERALVVADAATGREEWRVPLTSYGYGRPAVANLTASPGPEVVASDIDGVVVAVNDGRVQWRHDLHSTVWADPLVTDLDGDDSPEILFGANDNTTLLSASGEVEWETPVGGLTTAVARTGGSAFVAGSGHVTALDGATGDREWQYTVDGTVRVHDARDGTVYVGVSGGEVLALDAGTGDVAWRYTFAETDQTVTPAPVLGDVTGGGSTEVVAVNSDGSVAVLDATSGEQLDAYSRDVPIWTVATVASVDDDGADEVFVRYGDGRVAALEYE